MSQRPEPLVVLLVVRPKQVLRRLAGRVRRRRRLPAAAGACCCGTAPVVALLLLLLGAPLPASWLVALVVIRHSVAVAAAAAADASRRSLRSRLCCFRGEMIAVCPCAYGGSLVVRGAGHEGRVVQKARLADTCGHAADIQHDRAAFSLPRSRGQQLRGHNGAGHNTRLQCGFDPPKLLLRNPQLRLAAARRGREHRRSD